MKLTIVHPCIGRRIGQRYIRSWQMEPLPAARLAGLTSPDVSISFYDDRMERVPFDAPCDLAAISVETYTARRAYQIASEYRKRRVPVVMGGFHATLRPEEVARYAEHVITGDADRVWPEFLDDFRHGRAGKFYHGKPGGALEHARYDRSIFAGKRYLPIGLIETGRGCNRKCDFCAIQSFFQRTHASRPAGDVVDEIRQQKARCKLFFFVDDNFVTDRARARELLLELGKTGIRWITQMSIDAAHDEAFLSLMARSGCAGVLIGFESLDPDTLREVNKSFALMKGGYETAMANLTRAGIRVYGTFIFGNDGDRPESFEHALDFANRHKFYIAAFNHITPFPGTPLYERLLKENRLTMPDWWLDPRYRYNMAPFRPRGMSAEEVRAHCIRARKRFYSPLGMARRGFSRINMQDAFMFRHFFPINIMHRLEIPARDGLPMGDAAWRGELLETDAS